jgi:glutamine amidotransferase
MAVDTPAERRELPEAIVLDYGAGNLRSVVRAVEHVGYRATLSDSPDALARASAVILPGVGAAADTISNLRNQGLVEPIKEYIASDRPFLGVCMGLQALMTVSEEGGEHPCLDVLPGRVVRLADGQTVPHMGWNAVKRLRSSDLFDGIPDGSHFYFVHSYHCVLDDPSAILATTTYGTDIAAVIQHGNIVATQFHPEKSGAYGLQIYRNFLHTAFRSAAAN